MVRLFRACAAIYHYLILCVFRHKLRIFQTSKATTKAEKIWQDAKSGDVKELTKHLKGATAADLCLEEEVNDNFAPERLVIFHC